MTAFQYETCSIPLFGHFFYYKDVGILRHSKPVLQFDEHNTSKSRGEKNSQSSTTVEAIIYILFVR